MISTVLKTKSALYVDFDNIYISLWGEDPRAAAEFATAPERWLRWIEEGMAENSAEAGAGGRRDVLVRRCYLNPQSFRRFRAYFTRSGFSVIDCPPLTARNKNSADIVMVMDIIDALEHKTRFDEFIIMSGDADFTPVLHRLRMHDRRTAVLASGSGAAAAYKAACDHLIREDVFIENGLRVADSSSPLLDTIADRLYDVVEGSPYRALPVVDLPGFLRQFPQFTVDSNWLGFYSMRALTNALIERRPELQYVDGDPAWIRLRPAGETDAARPAAAAPAFTLPTGEDLEGLRARVGERVRTLVAASADPVVLARAAHELTRAFGDVLPGTNWLGAGSFSQFLSVLPGGGFAVAATPIPGYLYDPDRHQMPPESESSKALADLPPEMVALIRRVSQVIDAPRLSPPQYRLVFELIAQVVGTSGYHLITTGRTVRDRCAERGEAISRQNINWILRGLSYAGAFKTEGPLDARELAVAFRENVLKLLRSAGLTLDETELALLDAWLLLGEPLPYEDAANESAAGSAAGEADADGNGLDERPPLEAEQADVPAPVAETLPAE